MTIKSNFIIICEEAFLTAGTNNLNLIGIFTNINAERFPLTYRRFALVANFDTDAQGTHTLETRVLDDNGREIVKSSTQVTISTSPFQVIANFENLIFPKPGKYELYVSLDGMQIGSRSLTLHPLMKKTSVA